MPAPTFNDCCPLCGGSVKMKFPDHWPTLAELTAIYSLTVLRASQGVFSLAAKVMGVSFNTLKRRLANAEAIQRKMFPMGDAEATTVLKYLKQRQDMKPVGHPGLCRGDWVEIAKGEAGVVYDIRFSEQVTKYDAATFALKGETPFVLMFDTSEAARELEFGTPVEEDSICTFSPAGPRQIIVTVTARGIYDKANAYFSRTEDPVPAVLPAWRSRRDDRSDGENSSADV